MPTPNRWNESAPAPAPAHAPIDDGEMSDDDLEGVVGGGGPPEKVLTPGRTIETGGDDTSLPPLE